MYKVRENFALRLVKSKHLKGQLWPCVCEKKWSLCRCDPTCVTKNDHFAPRSTARRAAQDLVVQMCKKIMTPRNVWKLWFIQNIWKLHLWPIGGFTVTNIPFWFKVWFQQFLEAWALGFWTAHNNFDVKFSNFKPTTTFCISEIDFCELARPTLFEFKGLL